MTLYLKITEITIDDEQLKQVSCRIDLTTLPRLFTYPASMTSLEIKDTVSNKLRDDGYEFTDTILE